jgi:microcompartment protein CcmL/EutN
MAKSIGLIESRGLVALVEAADVILKNSPVKILGIHKLNNSLVSLVVFGEADYVKAAIDSGVDAGKKVGEIFSHSVVDNPTKELMNLFSELYQVKDENSEISNLSKSIELLKSRTEQIQKHEEVVVENVQQFMETKTQSVSVAEKPKKIKVKVDQVKKEKIEKDIPVESKEVIPKAGKTLSTIERLRKEALGPEEKKSTIKQGNNDKVKTSSIRNNKVDFKIIKGMNVHKLRRYARSFDRFPIKGREISRANRDELVKLFESMI